MNSSTTLVSSQAMLGMVVAGVICTVGPILLLILWRIKKKCNLMPALAGALIFPVFALGLETVPKLFLLTGNNQLSQSILGNVWATAFTTALLAGIFEECGRFVAFRFFLKKYNTPECAITYGIGHGGIECILLVGLGMISNLSLAMLINSGSFDTLIAALPADQAASYQTLLTTLTTSGFATYLVSIWERIFALLLHISLSVLVFTAVKNPSRRILFPLSILLHGLIDFPAAFYQFGYLSLAGTEVFITLISVGCAVFAFHVYRTDFQQS